MYVYCLYCQPQRCKKIAALLECQGIERAVSPQVIQNHRKQGRIEEVSYDLLPGYVFLYSTTLIESFHGIRSIDGVYRILGTEETLFQLDSADYSFAMNIYDKKGVIGNVRMVREGDIVRIDSPLFSGMDAKVLRVDYRKHRAQISYQFDKQEWKTWVSCDVIFLNEKGA